MRIPSGPEQRGHVERASSSLKTAEDSSEVLLADFRSFMGLPLVDMVVGSGCPTTPASDGGSNLVQLKERGHGHRIQSPGKVKLLLQLAMAELP
jgi:hypothetical protein